MNHKLLERAVECPYCGETINILLDLSVDEQRYIEDCQVCCRPVEIVCEAPAGSLGSVRTQRSD